MIYVGIDPGANGGFATIDTLAMEEFAVSVTPFKSVSLTLLSGLLEDIGSVECLAIVEDVHAMPGQGVVSTFNFGRNLGTWEGLLTGAGIPYDMVSPQKWQKPFNLLRIKGESKSAKKNRHKAIAQGLFPDINVTHAIADALLIAEYARSFYEQRSS